MEIWISILWLAATFVVMLLLQRWLEAHLQGLTYLLTGHREMALWMFFVIFLPGTIVHELSHWLVAHLLGVRAGRLEIWPRRQKGAVWLGSVQIGRADPLRSSLIGLAPLITGSCVVAAIGTHLRLDIMGGLMRQGDWQAVWHELSASARLPDFWLWIYLLFSVASRMLPSAADRQSWRPILLFVGLVSFALMLSGWTLDLGESVHKLFLEAVNFLLYAMTLIVAIDVIAVILIAVLEAIVGLLKQQRVVY